MGGQLADAKGSKFTICFGLLLQGATLLLFALAGVNLFVLTLVLMIFMLATWSISPAQQLFLVTLIPRNPDIALSVNTSFIQFGFALGSGLGGLVISNIKEHPFMLIPFLYSPYIVVLPSQIPDTLTAGCRIPTRHLPFF